MPTPAPASTDLLGPFLPRLVHDWLADEPEVRWRALDATVVFVDVSGFTRLSERLARRGRVGAEVLTDVISGCFSHLLTVAYAEGGGLLKFGGDALLILFSGDDHTERACRAAVGMRARLRDVAQIDVPGGGVRLRMSVGVHRGEFLLFLVGSSHRELVITGPAATETVTMESIADAGEIVVSSATAARLDPAVVGAPKGIGHLLRRAPGTASDAVAVPVAPRGVDLATGVPLALRPHLLGDADEAEHRVATVAFVHFDDVDEIVQNHGPAELADALDELVSDVATAANEHGITFLGTDIDKDGGKIILTAGVPLASGQDEERMLHALRRVASTPHRLPIRIGANRGHVFAGTVGPTYRRTYTVMGDTVNLAARLMAAAKPGQVLATPAVVEQARSTFDAQPLPPFMVKGKSRPVQALAVGAPIRTSPLAPAAPLALVGRAEESVELRDAMEAARAGHGRMVELRGEAGTGKSRLVHELRHAAPDVTMATVACLPYETTNPYWALRELLEQLLGVTDGDRDAVEARLREFVAERSPELVPWLPLLATPLQLDLADTPETAALAPRFRKQRVEETTVSLIAALLPTVSLVTLEDAHWMDDASTDVLRLVEQGVESGPWLVCVTRNDDDTGFHATRRESRVLHLEALDPHDAADLVRAATEEQPLRPHEVERLVERAGGNPRFLIELAREALATGTTDWLPESVDSLVSAQIDRLPRATRRFLRHASVLGHAFDTDLLAAVVDEIDMPRRPELDLGRYLVADGPGRLRFRHALLRDVAYGGLPYRSRAQLHRMAGEALEQSLTRPEDQAALLSLHFFHGERFDAAWRYGRLAAERASSGYANVEAAELYERAISAARRVEGVAPADFAAAAEALGDVRDRIGVYDGARDAYRIARRLLSDNPVQGAQLCLKEAWMAERLGRYSLAIRWLGRGMKLLDAHAENDVANASRAALSQRAQIAVWYAAVRETAGHHREAVRWCETAIELARASDDRDALAHALFVLDWAYAALGRLDLATHSAEALRLYEELGNLSGQAVVANNLGALAYYDGRWHDALALYEQARDARLRTGDAVEAALSSANIAEILIEQSRFDEAEALLLEARRVYRAANYRSGIACASARLGRVAARTGRLDEAYRLFEEAKRLYASVEGVFEAIEVDSMLAEALVLAGDANLALVVADAALVRARAEGEIGVLGPALYRTRGYALAQLGRFAEADDAVDESLTLARQQGIEYEVALDLVACERIDGWAGRAPRPSAEAVEILERLNVTEVPVASEALGASTISL